MSVRGDIGYRISQDERCQINRKLGDAYLPIIGRDTDYPTLFSPLDGGQEWHAGMRSRHCYRTLPGERPRWGVEPKITAGQGKFLTQGAGGALGQKHSNGPKDRRSGLQG